MRPKHAMMLVVLLATGGIGQMCLPPGPSSEPFAGTVTLSAVPNPALVNEPLTISATVEGGTPPYSFSFQADLVGVGSIANTEHASLASGVDSITIAPPAAGTVSVRVRVTDASGGWCESEGAIEVQQHAGDSGLCGQHENTDNIIIHGPYDLYQGEPVETSTVTVSVGQYVSFQANGFYDYVVHTPENTDITWNVSGSAAVLVSSTGNQATIHALSVGQVTLCVLGTDKNTGQLVGFRSVSIPIDTPGFRISSVELSNTNSQHIAAFIARIEGEPTAPFTLTLEAVGSGCPADANLPCYVGAVTHNQISNGQMFIGVSLADQCAAANGGTVYLRFYLKDASNMYTVPAWYEYSCSR